MSKKRKLSHPAKKYRHPAARARARGPPVPLVKPAGKPASLSLSSSVSSSSSSRPRKPPRPTPPPQVPIVPFAPHHRILLVGDGDLSFAASLAIHHACKNLTATVLDASVADLVARHPAAAANADLVVASSPASRVLYGVDARKKGPFKPLPPPTLPSPSPTSSSLSTLPLPPSHRSCSSASTFLTSSTLPPPSPPASAPGFDRIFFNFPHVGGKSTDVDRQVRYNQELLLAFFARATPSLAPAGAVVVTLFEGEPYSLWNIRDLARHCGLRLERSFRFPPAAYTGYGHVRTLGVVVRRSRKSSLLAVGSASDSAWRGEQRPARSYVFVRKEEGDIDLLGGLLPKKRKRRGGGGSSPSDDDSISDDDDGDRKKRR